MRSLTDDHPSNATNDRVRWNFLPLGRPLQVQCMSNNSTSVPNGGLLQCCTQIPLKEFNCFELSFILATLQRRSQIDVRCIVTMLPARRGLDTFVVIQAQIQKCFELAASGEQLSTTTIQHDVLCKMLRKQKFCLITTKTCIFTCC